MTRLWIVAFGVLIAVSLVSLLLWSRTLPGNYSVVREFELRFPSGFDESTWFVSTTPLTPDQAEVPHRSVVKRAARGAFQLPVQPAGNTDFKTSVWVKSGDLYDLEFSESTGLVGPDGEQLFQITGGPEWLSLVGYWDYRGDQGAGLFVWATDRESGQAEEIRVSSMSTASTPTWRVALRGERRVTYVFEFDLGLE